MSEPVTEDSESQETNWYDITISGKKFNVASRYGEPHIRKVESLLEQTFQEVQKNVEGQSTLHLALLTALNLADQLLTRTPGNHAADGEVGQRLEALKVRLESVLDPQRTSVPEPVNVKNDVKREVEWEKLEPNAPPRSDSAKD